MKNNITRLLDQRKIKYTAFELPAEKLGAEVTAEMLGMPPEIVFKTIVVKREGKGKPILAVVPGNREVDLKLLAKAVGEKKVFLTTQKEAEQLTQLQAGGISPLALINPRKTTWKSISPAASAASISACRLKIWSN